MGISCLQWGHDWGGAWVLGSRVLGSRVKASWAGLRRMMRAKIVHGVRGFEAYNTARGLESVGLGLRVCAGVE
jgi:hypothetical protein